ncbi:MAG TPA: GAF domain-containing protein [Aggregatilineaceae bacterium]|nr:GAF domain-containing protein [Aggregatilineaceae bacterium]
MTRISAYHQKLSTHKTLPEWVRIVADYASYALVEITRLEYEEGQPQRVYAATLTSTGELAEQHYEISKFPLGSILTMLQQGRLVEVDDVYASPLIAAEYHAYFRSHQVTGLTIWPLTAENRLLGSLAVAASGLGAETRSGLEQLAQQIALLMYVQQLAERAAALDADMQQVYRLGGAILDARDIPSLMQSVFQQFSPPPDELALDQVQGKGPFHTVTAITAQGTNGMSVLAHGALAQQARKAGTPLLYNHVKMDLNLSVDARAYLESRHIQALGLFPIQYNGEHTYTLSIAYGNPHLFTASEIRLLHQLAAQIGFSVRYWNLQKQTDDQSKQLVRQGRGLEALSEVSRRISASLTNPDMLQALCQRLVEIMQLEYAAVVRFDQVPGSGNVVGEHPSRASMLFALDGFAAYQQMQAERAPILIKAVDTASDVLGPNQARFQALGLRTAILAPLLVHGGLIGMLMLATKDTFEQSDVLAAQVAAIHVAIGLRNTELFVEIQHRASQLERIAAFGRLVTSTFDREEIFRRVADVIPHLLPAPYASLALYTTGQSEIRLIGLDNSESFTETRLPANESSIAEVVLTQSPLLIADLAQSPYPDHPPLVRQGIHSLLTAPLAVGGAHSGDHQYRALAAPVLHADGPHPAATSGQPSGNRVGKCPTVPGDTAASFIRRIARRNYLPASATGEFTRFVVPNDARSWRGAGRAAGTGTAANASRTVRDESP